MTTTSFALESADRVDVMGCAIDRIDMPTAVVRCDQIIRARIPTQLVAINAAKLTALRRDARLRKIVEGCGLVHADGQSILWAAKLLGTPLPERIPGIELMFQVLRLAEREGYRVYILGARPDVLERAIHELQVRYPGPQGVRISPRVLFGGRAGSGGDKDTSS